MSENGNLSNEEIEKKKKGRKPTVNNYFDVREEDAVRAYLIAESSEEKNKIYNQFLKNPLDKMTHSFLMTKIDKFKPAKEKKAYSYFGTICKNYLMGQILKDQKEMNRKISYEDISGDVHNMPDMIYYIDNEDVSSEEIIKKFLNELKDNMNEPNISEQEIKLGEALTDIFTNYGVIFQETSNNNKFNKNIILFELREMTNLSTKEIRNSLKRYKKIYFHIVNELLK